MASTYISLYFVVKTVFVSSFFTTAQSKILAGRVQEQPQEGVFLLCRFAVFPPHILHIPALFFQALSSHHLRKKERQITSQFCIRKLKVGITNWGKK